MRWYAELVPVRMSAAQLVVGLLSLLGFSALAGLNLRGSASEPVDAFTVVPVSSTSFRVLDGEATYISLDVMAWETGWRWLHFEGNAREDSGSTVLQASTRTSGGATLTLSGSLVQRGRESVVLQITITSDRDADLTGISLAVSPDPGRFAGGMARSAGREEMLPIERRGLGSNVGEFELIDSDGRMTKFELDPALAVGSDGAIRISLVGESISADSPVSRRVTLTLPEPGRLYGDARQVPDRSGMDDWYEFRPSGLPPTDEDELSMAGWLPRPAGKDGRIRSEGDELRIGGERIRLWGVNVCFADCAPPRELAERRAKFYARNGINAVRLHKYADGSGWAGIQSPGSFVEFDREALDRMDYFVSMLKAEGIYVKLSPTFGVRLGPEDYDRLPYASEFGQRPRHGERLNTQHGTIYLSEEIQELQIRQTIKLLNHRNPYTGLTYAEDPAIAIVEMYNEDSALFYGTMARLQNVPTLRQRASREFTEWLRTRYGSEAQLIDAWGTAALNSFGAEGFLGESYADGSIVPAGNPWFYDPDQLGGSQVQKARRLYDTMLFWYERQNAFYDRFLVAIRDAGYDGEVLSSNWFAGRAFSHFYNLHSDARIGMIDRHNYWGGGSGSDFDDRTMLARPGSGILSLGHSQVEGRPFSISEWIHVFPNEWGVEGPAIIGAYGMGLQGWDVSFTFQNRDAGYFSSRIGRDQWDATAPQIMGVFPAVARQIHRGDVRESELTIPRNVHIDSLYEGRLGFDDRSTAAGDFKTSDSNTVPIEAIAVGKSVVRFTDRFEETPRFDFQPFVDGNLLRSSTRELVWSGAEGGSTKAGWFSIDTPGTQALVGFASGVSADLADVEIRSESEFAAIYVTARDRAETIGDGKSILVTALARARNSGMNIRGSLLLGVGVEPILLEPVKAEITLKRSGTPTVYVLDHDGRRTDRTVPVSGGVIRLDTGRDRAFSYLIVYP